MSKAAYAQAYRKINNRLGSRHKKAWAKRVKAKAGTTQKLGKTSHAIPPQNR